MSVQGKFIPKPQSIGQGSSVQAEAEFKSKYPNTLLSNKDLLRRKVSSQGGKQYFDSGDYVMKKKLPGAPGGAPQGPNLLGVGTEVATVDKIPMRKTSQKAPIPITSPKKSSNLILAPGLASTVTNTEAHRDISPMATNPPPNPLTRHHLPPHMQQFHERAPLQQAVMKPPPALSVAPATSMVSSPPQIIQEADSDDMV